MSYTLMVISSTIYNEIIVIIYNLHIELNRYSYLYCDTFLLILSCVMKVCAIFCDKTVIYVIFSPCNKNGIVIAILTVIMGKFVEDETFILHRYR